MNVKLALPASDARGPVAAMLAGAGIATTGYEPGSRTLRSVLPDDGLTLRAFREKDIPVQVAMGNYDLGICGDLWLSEMQVRFPLQRIVRIGGLPGPAAEVWLAAAASSGLATEEVPSGIAGARIASELPNLADLVATHLRFPGYRLLTVSGSAEAYPPDDADFALLPAPGADAGEAMGLCPLWRGFPGGPPPLPNADALATKPLGGVLAKLKGLLSPEMPAVSMPHDHHRDGMRREQRSLDVVRIAVPDGHAQRHTPACLAAAGLSFEGYDEGGFVRRPASSIAGLEVKVVRPQDMPQLVAMGVFDIGISGRDLLWEHQCRFPGSPVEMAVDLGRNRYRIGPVVDQAFPADTTAAALPLWRALGRRVRIASEFPATAERFARDLDLDHATIIPVAGASEGYVPEDADFLVEGTETGTSIRANGLKMLDPFMESTNCVIVRSEPVTTRTALLDDLVAALRASVAEAVP